MATDIPDDILVLIFFFCLQTDPYNAPTTPMYLSHVCSTWRTLALDTAQLWTSITFSQDYQTEIHPEPPIHFARQQEWIRRSKGALLDIEISAVWTLEAGLIDRAKARILWIIDLLTPHAHRWRTLDLSAGRSPQMEFFFENIKTPSFPNLNAFNISHSCGDKRCTIRAFRPGSMPRLERLRTSGLVNFDRPFIDSLVDLRHIEISALNFSADVVEGTKEIVAMIRRSPQLETLHINGPPQHEPFHWDRPTTVNRNIATASHLTYFAVWSRNLQAAVLPFIQAPAFSGYNWSTAPEFLPIIQLYNPFPNLRHIYINDSGFDCTYPISDLPGMLAHLIALEHLTIFKFNVFGGNRDKKWILKFSDICPKLRILHLEWKLGISEDAMRNLVENRKAWGHPTTSLTLEVDDVSDISEELSTWLKSNVAEVFISEEDGCAGFGLFD